MQHLLIQDVSLAYQRRTDGSEFLALEGVNLDIDRGEFVTIVGPSGCGKSSLLVMVNGLLQPTSGQITLNGKRVQSPSPERALVFQEFALLPWRTALSNVELGLELLGQPAAQRRETASRNIRMVGLSAFERYFPHQLSGGMRQRIGIARALSVNPEVLLMDEPYGSLDAQIRQIMADDLLRLWELDRKTILFVTHDIDEAIFLADRVVVMSASPGRVLEIVGVELPRPRTLAMKNQPLFVEYRQRIWEHLESEVRTSMARELEQVRP